MIDATGIYDIPEDDYHADPCAAPSLSHGLAVILLGQSPLHARQAHPRLTPDHVREHDEKFDRGTAAHRYVLQGESGFELIDAKDWRTNAAKEARDAAYAAGKLPLLAHRWEEVLQMATALEWQLARFRDPPRPFTTGLPERTLVWTEETPHGPIFCRARPDWLHDDWAWIDDYKTTGGSGNPAEWGRTLFGAGYDVQDAFYSRGLQSVAKAAGKTIDPRFRFIVQENFSPFAASVVAIHPASRALAMRKVEAAIATFAECLYSDRWPGYPERTAHVEIPSYLETAWIAREEREIQEVAS